MVGTVRENYPELNGPIVFHASNRLNPPSDEKKSPGGLDEVLSESYSPDAWMVRIGIGKTLDIDPKDYRLDETAIRVEKGTDYGLGKIVNCMLDVPAKSYDTYYRSKNTLEWPLNHLRLDIVDDHYRPFQNGQRVFNQHLFDEEVAASRCIIGIFSEFIIKQLQPTAADVGIIHDYQLTELGQLLRDGGVFSPLTFFLHIPGAEEHQVRRLHEAQQRYVRRQYRTLSAYDLVGVQAPRDLRNIWSIAGPGPYFGGDPELYRPYTMEHKEFRGVDDWQKQFTSIGVIPVVGHYNTYEAKAIGATDAARKFLQGIGFPENGSFRWPQIFTWSRLDYSKGGPTQLRAIEKAIEFGLAAKDVCFFHQAAFVSRKDVPGYQEEHDEIAAGHERLMGKYEASGLQARLHTGELSREMCLAIARHARVGLITPLIDGFNLTAAEYVSVQGERDPGVLILGRDAGAANLITEKGAILVNAADPEEVAAAIIRAVNMSLEERRKMHREAKRGLSHYNNQDWQLELIEGAQKCRKQHFIAAGLG